MKPSSVGAALTQAGLLGWGPKFTPSARRRRNCLASAHVLTLKEAPIPAKQQKRGVMDSLNKKARVAGLLYLLLAIPGPFSLIYIPATLIVRGNATATASNILAHETLFRLGMVADVASAFFFVILVMALYRLLSGVNKAHASLMVALVLVSAAIGCANVLPNVAALTLFRGGDFLAVLDKPQRDALAMLFLRLHGQGNVINEAFWGLWLVPFGMLVFRSGFLPRILGVWLVVNGFAYVALSFTGLLFPDYSSVAFRMATPLLFGELAIMCGS